MANKYIKNILFLTLLPFSWQSIAQDTARVHKVHEQGQRPVKTRKHKKATQPKGPTEAQKQATKQRLLQRTLKEKNYHIPDSLKHK